MSTPARNSLGRFTSTGATRRAAVRKADPSSWVRGGGTLDTRLWTVRLRQYVKSSNSSVPVALNKAGRSACYRAIRKTPKTKLAQITADMGTPSKPAREAYALYIWKHHLKGAALAGVHDKVIRMVKSKRSSIAYIAAGFFRALRAFTSTAKDVTPSSIAARGYGIRARVDRYFSEIFNTAPGADEMASGPLAVAAVEALDDMMDHLQKTQNSAAKKFNA